MESWDKIFCLNMLRNLTMKNTYCNRDRSDLLLLGGNSSMTCRVIAEEKTCIPANSSAWITVKIPSQEHLKTKTAFVEPNES